MHRCTLLTIGQLIISLFFVCSPAEHAKTARRLLPQAFRGDARPVSHINGGGRSARASPEQSTRTDAIRADWTICGVRITALHIHSALFAFAIEIRMPLGIESLLNCEASIVYHNLISDKPEWPGPPLPTFPFRSCVQLIIQSMRSDFKLYKQRIIMLALRKSPRTHRR